MKVEIVLTILEYCSGRNKTSTITVLPIPGIETSVISVFTKNLSNDEFVQVEFQVKLF